MNEKVELMRGFFKKLFSASKGEERVDDKKKETERTESDG